MASGFKLLKQTCLSKSNRKKCLNLHSVTTNNDWHYIWFDMVPWNFIKNYKVNLKSWNGFFIATISHIGIYFQIGIYTLEKNIFQDTKL